MSIPSENQSEGLTLETLAARVRELSGRNTTWGSVRDMVTKVVNSVPTAALAGLIFSADARGMSPSQVKRRDSFHTACPGSWEQTIRQTLMEILYVLVTTELAAEDEAHWVRENRGVFFPPE